MDSTRVWEPFCSERGAFWAPAARAERGEVVGGAGGVKVAALGLGLLLGALAVGPWPAGAAPSSYILGADVVAVDADSNGLFDYLNISVVLDPPQAGSYLVAATLRWPSTGTTIASVSAVASLQVGASRFPLRVEGAAISEKQLDGPYNLTVDLISSPSGPVRDEASFTTGRLDAASFERGALADKPRLRVGSEAVQLSSPSINASVDLTRPAVRWGPAAAAGASGGAAPAFEATFPRVVAFADGGDHAFETPEEVCAANLTRGNWSITALEVGPSADLGSYIRFTLSSAVSFEGAACERPVAGAMALSFLISQRNGTVEGATPVAILGGLEVKVDLALTLDGPVTASDLAFEVELRDLSGATGFLVRGPRGFEALAPAQGDLPVEPLTPGQAADIERVSFVDAEGAPAGHFAWLALAAENLTGGSERFVQVSASRGVSGSALQLYLGAPNDAQLGRLVLDPVVGVPPHAQAPGGGETPPPAAEPRPSFVVFVAALAAVAAMFFFSVYARAKKY